MSNVCQGQCSGHVRQRQFTRFENTFVTVRKKVKILKINAQAAV